LKEHFDNYETNSYYLLNKNKKTCFRKKKLRDYIKFQQYIQNKRLQYLTEDNIIVNFE